MLFIEVLFGTICHPLSNHAEPLPQIASEFTSMTKENEKTIQGSKYNNSIKM